jgi:hypothetical protein
MTEGAAQDHIHLNPLLLQEVLLIAHLSLLKNEAQATAAVAEDLVVPAHHLFLLKPLKVPNERMCKTHFIIN